MIVVLVILAILAAMMVPALLGWIDEARNKQYVLEARSIYMAAQAIADEKYASKAEKLTKDDLTSTDAVARIIKLADVTVDTGWLKDCTVKGATGHDAFTIKEMFITFTSTTTDSGSGKTVYATLKDNSWTVLLGTKPSPAPSLAGEKVTPKAG